MLPAAQILHATPDGDLAERFLLNDAISNVARCRDFSFRIYRQTEPWRDGVE